MINLSGGSGDAPPYLFCKEGIPIIHSVKDLGAWAENEAHSILRWWIERDVDDEKGGFYGYVAQDGTPDKNADRLLILGARLVWTYAAAYRIFQRPEYKKAAEHFYRYFVDHFMDREHGGAFWELTCDGKPKETAKNTYGQAFTLYALSEYARATGDQGARELAREQFTLLEEKVYDAEHNGYREYHARDWSQVADARPRRHKAVFTMNTSLHLIEAYTNFLRLEDTPKARAAVEKQLAIMVDKVRQPNNRFALFFDENWKRTDTLITYGHDIEGSWLLYETAEVLGDEDAIHRLKDISVAMAEAVMDGGIDPSDGGLYDERDYQSGELFPSKGWWQQAEAAVGFFNAYQLSGDEKFLKVSLDVANFIQSDIVDHEYGEWFGVARAEIGSEGRHTLEKVSGWKCPYHNARMCFELIERSSVCTTL